VSLEKNMDGGQMRRLGEKLAAKLTFVLTAFISFGLFNIFGEPAEKECNKCDLTATQFF
jgi:hypothetical protein